MDELLRDNNGNIVGYRIKGCAYPISEEMILKCIKVTIQLRKLKDAMGEVLNED